MDHQAIRSTLLECLIEEYALAKDDGLKQRLQWRANEQRLSMRLYYLNDTTAKSMWDTLRRDEEMLHFIMMLSIGFKMRVVLDYGSNAYSELCELMDRSMSNLASEQVADSVFCEQIPSGAKLGKITSLLVNNPWLVVSILIERNNAYLTEHYFAPPSQRNEDH